MYLICSEFLFGSVSSSAGQLFKYNSQGMGSGSLLEVIRVVAGYCRRAAVPCGLYTAIMWHHLGIPCVLGTPTKGPANVCKPPPREAKAALSAFQCLAWCLDSVVVNPKKVLATCWAFVAWSINALCRCPARHMIRRHALRGQHALIQKTTHNLQPAENHVDDEGQSKAFHKALAM